ERSLAEPRLTGGGSANGGRARNLSPASRFTPIIPLSRHDFTLALSCPLPYRPSRIRRAQAAQYRLLPNRRSRDRWLRLLRLGSVQRQDAQCGCAGRDGTAL